MRRPWSPFLAALAGLVLATGLGLCQTANKPAFEVASVKPTALDTAKLASLVEAGQKPKMGRSISGQRVEYSYMSMRELIAEAYHVKYDRVSGPDWLNTVRFDIRAVMPEGTGAEDSPMMLQGLLQSRFQLAVHRETREHAVMALTVGKDGPKLREYVPPAAGASDPAAPKATFAMNPSGDSMHYEASAMTMAELADTLTAFSKMGGGDGRTVVDMTRLMGRYRIALDIPVAALRNVAQATRSDIPNTANRADGTGNGASDPTALSMLDSIQALGLRMERQKAALEEIIVDRVEKSPTEN